MNIDLNPERWLQIKQLFEKLTALDPDKRASFLDEHCSSDKELREELESLVRADSCAGNFLEAPVLVDPQDPKKQDPPEEKESAGSA